MWWRDGVQVGGSKCSLKYGKTPSHSLAALDFLGDFLCGIQS